MYVVGIMHSYLLIHCWKSFQFSQVIAYDVYQEFEVQEM